MKKLLFLLGFLSLLSFPLITGASTVYGFMNGQFYTESGDLRYACLIDGNCYDYTTKQLTNLNTILGLSGSGTVTVDSTSTPTVLPTPTLSPTITPMTTPNPTQNPIVQGENLKPAYTKAELAKKLGFSSSYWPEGTSVQKNDGFILIYPTAKDGAVVPGLTITVNGNVICQDGSTCQTPDGVRSYGRIDTVPGEYDYVIRYSEDGREDTLITGKIIVN